MARPKREWPLGTVAGETPARIEIGIAEGGDQPVRNRCRNHAGVQARNAGAHHVLELNLHRVGWNQQHLRLDQVACFGPKQGGVEPQEAQ